VLSQSLAQRRARDEESDLTRPFSLWPGAATQTEFRALILASPGRQPKVVQTRVCNGATAAVTAEAVDPIREVHELMASRGIQSYRIHAKDLLPGERYRYDIDAGDGRKGQLTVQTLPNKLPEAGITIAVGTCYYGGYRKDQNLGAALRSMRLGGRASLQIWAGDNLYLDIPAFSTENAPYQQTLDRYLEYFLHSDYWRARSATANWTTFDDHDFWNNYPEHSLWLDRDDDDRRAGYIRAAIGCLQHFQSSLNPAPVRGENTGYSYTVDLDPISFFVADTRVNRDQIVHGRGRLMTEPDLSSLQKWASDLNGPGILVLGQPLWIEAGVQLADYNPPAFSDYKAIWRALRAARYDTLVVTGDVHYSRIMRLSAGGRNVYEFVSSPASHIPNSISSVLRFLDKQDRSSIDPPTRDPGSGLGVTPRYFFGTSAPNSIGMLWLRPDARRNVRVGAGFVDYSTSPRWAAAMPPETAVPRFGRKYKQCVDENLFVLRNRFEYV